MDNVKQYTVFSSQCSVTVFARSPEDALKQAKDYREMKGEFTVKLYDGVEKTCTGCSHHELDTDAEDWDYEYCKKHDRRVDLPVFLLPCDDYEEDKS